jgi:hypothetical protein
VDDVLDEIGGAGISAAVGLIGVVVGAWVQTRLDYRHRVVPDLHAAALRCLARLERIKAARRRDDANAVSGEVWNLGADLDRYVLAIGAATATREGSLHAAVLPRLSDILVEGVSARDEDIESAIEDLEQLEPAVGRAAQA